MKDNKIVTTILLAVFLSVMGWVGTTSLGNGRRLGKLDVKMDQNLTDHGRLEKGMAEMVSRREFEIELAGIKAKLAGLEVDMLKMRMREPK